MDTIESLRNTTPHIAAKFRVLETLDSPKLWNRGASFVTVMLGCKCGSPTLKVKTVRPSAAAVPPAYLTCCHCGMSELLFDEGLHGWNGEMEKEAANVAQSDLVAYSADEGAVLITYSYQNVENYDDLIAEGVKNPEDYFDTFTVYFRQDGASNFASVLSCECA